MEYKDFWLRTNTQIKLLNKTQRGLALECGFTERRIETLSSTCRSPDVIEAVKIAQALNTTVEYLVTGINENQAEKELTELKAKLADLIMFKK
jgi:transcriptional regulator with XRE-family HTH domain